MGAHGGLEDREGTGGEFVLFEDGDLVFPVEGEAVSRINKMRLLVNDDAMERSDDFRYGGEVECRIHWSGTYVRSDRGLFKSSL